MIYMRKNQQNSEPYGWSVPVPDDMEIDPDADQGWTIEQLMAAVESLDEGEALAIWKEA